MARVTDAVLFRLIRDFLMAYLPSQKNSSPHTIRAYRSSLDMLLDFVKKQKAIPIGEITFDMLSIETISAFLDYLEVERNCSISTRNHRLKCIRAFFSYAASMEPTTVIYLSNLQKIPWKKDDKPNIIDYMSEKAVKSLLEQPSAKTSKGLRDQFFMILSYDTAARVQEMVDLRLKDIRLGKTPSATLTGKGSKVRTVPLMEKTVQHLHQYVNVFHSGEDFTSGQYLFYVCRKGVRQRMSTDNVRHWMKAYGANARTVCSEVPEIVHPHLLRHSRAMHLYQHGMDLTLVSQWLGHSQLETTLVYAHADTEQKRKAIEKATSSHNLLNSEYAAPKYDVNDEDVLKRLYGLK